MLATLFTTAAVIHTLVGLRYTHSRLSASVHADTAAGDVRFSADVKMTKNAPKDVGAASFAFCTFLTVGAESDAEADERRRGSVICMTCPPCPSGGVHTSSTVATA